MAEHPTSQPPGQGQPQLSVALTNSACQPQAHAAASPGRQLECPTCGRPRCVSTAKGRDPRERCRRNPHPGARVCRNHGLTKAGRDAAAEARAQAAAGAALAELWPGLATAEAVTDPVDLLARTASVLERMTDTVGERVNDLASIATGEGGAQLRAEVVLLERLLARLVAASESLARLGLAERQIELAAGQADIVVRAARAMLAELALPPAEQARLVAVFLGALGRGGGIPAPLGLPSGLATSPTLEESP